MATSYLVDEEEDLLPNVDEAESGGGGFVSPATPSQGWKPRHDAMDSLSRIEASRPTREQYKPSTARKVLGGIAAVGLGAAAGYVNSGKRIHVDPDTGGELGSAIINGKYRTAMGDWKDREQKAARMAQLEGQQNKTDAETELHQQRISTEQRRQAAYDARRAQAEKIPAPKPIERNPENDLIVPDSNDPTGYRTVVKGTPKPVVHRTAEERINSILEDQGISPEEKQKRIDQTVQAHNRLHPEKPVTRVVVDDQGNATAVSVTPSQVAESGGRKPLGKIGKSRAPQRTTSTDVRTDVEAKTNLLIQQTGSVEKAIKFAGEHPEEVPLDVRDRLNRSQGIANRANPKAKGSKLLDKVIGQTGGAPAPGQPATAQGPSAGLPPEAVKQLKEGIVTTFRNGQKWTLKNGQPAKVS